MADRSRVRCQPALLYNGSGEMRILATQPFGIAHNNKRTCTADPTNTERGVFYCAIKPRKIIFCFLLVSIDPRVLSASCQHGRWEDKAGACSAERKAKGGRRSSPGGDHGDWFRPKGTFLPRPSPWQRTISPSTGGDAELHSSALWRAYLYPPPLLRYIHTHSDYGEHIYTPPPPYSDTFIRTPTPASIFIPHPPYTGYIHTHSDFGEHIYKFGKRQR
jgi:hypothetical protein